MTLEQSSENKTIETSSEARVENSSECFDCNLAQNFPALNITGSMKARLVNWAAIACTVLFDEPLFKLVLTEYELIGLLQQLVT